MSDDSLSSGPAARPADVTPGRPATATGVLDPARPLPDGNGPGTWNLGWSGVRTVAVLELRQRIRSTRWTAVLALWVGALALLTVIVRWAVHRLYESALNAEDVASATNAATDQLADQAAGRLTFGIIVFLVLSLAGLVSPALSATSINGDRQAGVLATLQTTLLSPAQIVVGKLLAAWATGLALLAAALPFIGWTYLDGGTPFGRLAVVLAVLALTILVVCAVGLGWSAITARTSSSAVLTYLTVAFLGPGLPLLFLLSVPIVSEVKTVPVRQQQFSADGAPRNCEVVEDRRSLTYTNRSWWLLAASPYVVVADASPKPLSEQNTNDDPLSVIRDGVREARLGPRFPIEACYLDQARAEQIDRDRAAQREALGVTWPYGLAADLALGGLFVVLAVRRLRTPTRRLPTGTRVA